MSVISRVSVLLLCITRQGYYWWREQCRTASAKIGSVKLYSGSGTKYDPDYRSVGPGSLAMNEQEAAVGNCEFLLSQ